MRGIRKSHLSMSHLHRNPLKHDLYNLLFILLVNYKIYLCEYIINRTHIT